MPDALNSLPDQLLIHNHWSCWSAWFKRRLNSPSTPSPWASIIPPSRQPPIDFDISLRQPWPNFGATVWTLLLWIFAPFHSSGIKDLATAKKVSLGPGPRVNTYYDWNIYKITGSTTLRLIVFCLLRDPILENCEFCFSLRPVQAV